MNDAVLLLGARGFIILLDRSPTVGLVDGLERSWSCRPQQA